MRKKYRTGRGLIEAVEPRILLSAAEEGPAAGPDVLTGGSIVVGGTAEDTTNGLNVRSTPAGTVVGTVDADVRGSVLGGPEVAELNGVSVTWWDVKWPNLSGWCAAEFLENVYSDLHPENLALGTAGGVAGSSVEVSFEVDNIGNGVSLGTTANIVLSTSSSAPGASDPVLGSVDVGALAYTGGEASFSPTVTIPAGTANGQYYIWIVPDPAGTANQGPNAGTDTSAPFTVGFAVLNDGVLSVLGTSASDSIVVSDESGTVVATLNGTGSMPFSAADITGMSITGGAGNDTISIAEVPIAATIGGAGGDDCITGGAGNDSLRGGSGNDTVGGAGGDDTVIGGGEDDCVKGGAGDDLIAGGPGNNTIHGGTGNDSIVTGAGDNVVNGNLGNDTIVAGAGSSQLFAGPGNDSIVGSTTAGDQPDSIYCGGSGDTISAGMNDLIYDSVQGDEITGGNVVA